VIAGPRAHRRSPAEQLVEGREITVTVLNPEDRNGNVVLSMARAQEDQDWREAEQLLASQEVYQGTVAGFNKGGLLVKIGKVRGFVPASQLHPGRRKRGEAAVQDEHWGATLGEAVQVKVIEVDRAPTA
jgi:small subunit ribosomal protein S1